MTYPILVKLPFFFLIQARRTNSGFSKTILGGYLFVFVNYRCNRSPEMRTKQLKNYISILTSVNYRNWLDASPSLRI